MAIEPTPPPWPPRPPVPGMPPPLPPMAPPPPMAWPGAPRAMFPPAPPLAPPAAVRRPPRSPGERRKLLLVAAAVVLLVSAGPAAILWNQHARTVRRDARVADDLFKHMDPASLASAPPTAGQRDDMVGIALFMDQVRSAFHDRNTVRIGNTCDGPRLAEECERERLIAPYTSADREAAVNGILQSQSNSYGKGDALRWEKHQIVRIQFPPPGGARTSGGSREAVVSLKTWDAKGEERVMRWWLKGSGRDWHWYDYEFLTGTRHSVVFGVLYARNLDSPPPWAGRLGNWDALLSATLKDDEKKMDAAGAALADEDPDDPKNGAANRAKDPSAASFPPVLEANCLHFRGARRQALGDNQGAIQLLDAAVALFPDLPEAYAARARAHNAAGHYAQGLADATRFRDQYAANAAIQRTIGNALLGLGRKAEAAAAYRKCLDEFPDDPDSFQGLTMTAGDPAELAGRLSKAHKPAELFQTVAQRLDNRGHAEALEALAGADRSVAPGDPWADFYQARALMIREQFERAADLLEPALTQAPRDSEGRDAAARFRNVYVTARLSAGQAVKAYRGLADALAKGSAKGPADGSAGGPADDSAEAPSQGSADRFDAFRTVAPRLAWSGKKEDVAALREVIAARRADAPSDPWLDYYTAKVAEAEKQPDAADAAYTRGLSLKLTKDAAEAYRSARVYERFRAGKGLSAYQDDSHPPAGRAAFRDAFRDATFLQLARLYSQAKKTDDLEKLVAMHRRNVPRSPAVALWQAEVLYERGSYEQAVRLLNDQRHIILSDKGQADTFFDRLIRCLVRLHRLDEAMTESQAAARESAEQAEQAEQADSSTPQSSPSPEPGESGQPAAPRPDPRYVLMIRAAEGDVAGATAAFDQCLEDDDDAAGLYSDPEIGPALRTQVFQSLRVKYPPPKPATRPAEDE